jgi:NADH-quinone oxidoreductase subunit I
MERSPRAARIQSRHSAFWMAFALFSMIGCIDTRSTSSEACFEGSPRPIRVSLLSRPAWFCVTRALTIAASADRLGIMNSFLRRLFLADFWKGLLLTFRTQNPKNVYTEQYPQERPMVAERYRGAPRLNMNPETGETLCISCNLCALACPENLIVVGWHRDDATRRKVLTTFTYDTSRCMFCGLCEDACPTDCLELTQDFEMASYSREGAIWDRHRLEEGPTPARYTR